MPLTLRHDGLTPGCCCDLQLYTPISPFDLSTFVESVQLSVRFLYATRLSSYYYYILHFFFPRFQVVFVVFLLHFSLDPGTTFLRTYISLISLFRWVALAASAFSFFEFVLYTFFFSSSFVCSLVTHRVGFPGSSLWFFSVSCLLFLFILHM